MKDHPEDNEQEIISYQVEGIPSSSQLEIYPIYKQNTPHKLESLVFFSEFGFFSAIMSSRMPVAKTYRMSIFMLLKDIYKGNIQLQINEDNVGDLENMITNGVINKTLKSQLK